jgi:transcriptional regulator with XRE-family HTH domain
VDVRKLRIKGRGLGVGKKIGIGSLRVATGLTQVDMAERMGMDQSQVSKIEAGEDHRVSTLRRYAEALGGELDIGIVLGARRYRIALAADRADAHSLECAEPARVESTRAKLRDAQPVATRRRSR